MTRHFVNIVLALSIIALVQGIIHDKGSLHLRTDSNTLPSVTVHSSRPEGKRDELLSIRYVTAQRDDVEEDDENSKRQDLKTASIERAILCPIAQGKRSEDQGVYNSIEERQEVLPANFSVCVPSDETSIALGNKNHQHNVVYNSLQKEYFMVYVEQPDDTTTSIRGLRMDPQGKVIEFVPIYTYADDPLPKHNPVLAWSSVHDVYLIVFDYETTPTEHDVVGIVINGTGYAESPAFYVGSSAFFGGADHSPSVAYDPVENLFMVLYAKDSGQYNSLVAQPLLTNGEPYDLWNDLSTSFKMENPSITYNTDQQYYYFVFDLTDGDYSDIFGIPLLSNAYLFNNTAILVAGTTLLDSTEIRDHNGKVVYSSPNQEYLLAFEIDLDGTDEGPTNVIIKHIDGYTWNPKDGFLTVGDVGDTVKSRNPTIAYEPESNEYLIGFESFIPSQGVNAIGLGTVLAATFEPYGYATVSDLQGNEFYPKLVVDTDNHQICFFYNHGVEAPPATSADNGDNVLAESSSETKSNVGAIVGAVFGTIAGVVIIGLIVFWIYLKRSGRDRKVFKEMRESEMSDNVN